MQEPNSSEKKQFPDVMVRIADQIYSINSRHIVSIIRMQEYKPMPGAPDEVLGVFRFRERAVPIFDMRSIFAQDTIRQEMEEFRTMIDARIQDHVKWVDKLEECISNGSDFPLATDPHKCAFGKWYYNFETDNLPIRYHLNKIEEPHRRLHELAGKLGECRTCADREKANLCLEQIQTDARDKYMPKIIDLLQQTKDVFKSAFLEMLIVLELDTRMMAIMVDEVIAVEELIDVPHDDRLFTMQRSPYVCGIRKRKRDNELILELDDEALLRTADEVKVE